MIKGTMIGKNMVKKKKNVSGSSNLNVDVKFNRISNFNCTTKSVNSSQK